MAASLGLADLVKLNTDELDRLRTWWSLPEDDHAASAALAARVGLHSVCVTRGAEGAALWHEGGWWTHGGHRVVVRDTVGAGDAFLAGLLAAMLSGAPPEAALDRAVRLGAFVASQPGALHT